MKTVKTSTKQQFFENHPEYLKMIKEMPHGSAAIIRERVIITYGEEFSYTLPYIRMVLDVNNTRMSRKILNVAIAYLNQIRIDESKIMAICNECKNNLS